MESADFKKEFKSTLKSLSPAIVLIFFFQIFFIRMPLSEFIPIVMGLFFAVTGFVLFIQGAKLGLLPMGERVGASLIERRDIFLIVIFGFLLGVVLTLAEPDVRLLAFLIGNVMPEISKIKLILITALGLGIFALIAFIRSVFDVNINYILISGYLICLILVFVSSEVFLVKAFDMSAVTTGPMTIPFLITIGVGMVSVLGRRNRLKSGFGTMAIASIGPIIVILIWGIIEGML
ncbi:MAG: DUF1538 domain-containing protein [Methanobacteriaceae archaeon]